MATRRVPNSAVINFNTTGDNTVIAALANAPINVVGIDFTVSAATNITFKGGNAASPTALSGAIQLTGAGSSLTLQIQPDTYFYCAPGTAFVMNQSGTAQVSGTVYYT